MTKDGIGNYNVDQSWLLCSYYGLWWPCALYNI